MKRTAIAVAGMSLTQCLVAAVIGMPTPAQAQARPNIAETMAPVPGRKNYAQDLVDRAASRHPELLQIDIHAVPPGATQTPIVAPKQPGVLIMVLHLKDPKSEGYPIVASNIGRIGKEADASDLAVIRGGATKLAVSADGTRLEAKLPVRDAAGNVVGAVAIVFPLRGAGDQASLGAHAERIRDGLARRIASMTALYGPYPATADSGAVQAEYNKQELGNHQPRPQARGRDRRDEHRDGRQLLRPDRRPVRRRPPLRAREGSRAAR